MCRMCPALFARAFITEFDVVTLSSGTKMTSSTSVLKSMQLTLMEMTAPKNVEFLQAAPYWQQSAEVMAALSKRFNALISGVANKKLDSGCVRTHGTRERWHSRNMVTQARATFFPIHTSSSTFCPMRQSPSLLPSTVVRWSEQWLHG